MQKCMSAHGQGDCQMMSFRGLCLNVFFMFCEKLKNGVSSEGSKMRKVDYIGLSVDLSTHWNQALTG